MEWIKKFLNWIKTLIKKSRHHGEEEISIKPQSIQKRKTRPIMPTLLNHNMPKYQPCPKGHGCKRRKEKTLGGAIYYCNKCLSNFFVRA